MKEHVHIIGIDPGKSGGIATISQILKEPQFMALKTPDSVRAMVEIIRVINKHAIKPKCYLENVHAFPTDGRSSVFKFGTNFGMWQGILASFNIETVLVDPRVWQKTFGTLPKQKQERKRKLKEIAIKETGVKATLSTADALCIALYGVKEYNGI
tara:strand:+ start:59 stop:523 length:465 start_codon:yes stop_codon:yes gene_type:complete